MKIMKYIRTFESIYKDDKPMKYNIGDYVRLNDCVVEIIHKYDVMDSYEGIIIESDNEDYNDINYLIDFDDSDIERKLEDYEKISIKYNL